MLKELNKKAKQLGVKFGDYCQGEMINKGYVWNDCFGWEKPEVLKQFNLDPDMEAIPSKRFEDENGKKKNVASDNYLNYIKWKKEQDEKRMRDEYIAEQQINNL